MAKDMIIQRNLISQIKIFLDNKEYIAIIGSRQSGKSVFLDLIKNYLIKEKSINSDNIKQITFEDRILLNQFDSDPVAFVNSYKNSASFNDILYLMIDEFQYSINGGQKIKLVYDTVANIKIIITGSSSLDIKAQVGKYMVGRILTFYLYPFSFEEFLSAKDQKSVNLYKEKNEKFLSWFLKSEKIAIEEGKDVFAAEFLKLYEEFAIFGGYPRVVLSETEAEKKKILNDIYSNYILKDIKGLLELATDKNLLDLTRFLAAQIGNILVYKNLSQIARLDYRKTVEHLRILEETFVIELVKPYFKNRQKELVKNPKVYFVDAGFRNGLMENMNLFFKRSDTGALAENAVFLRLKILLENFNKINFWRSKAGAEVDFVIDFNGKIFPIEVKFSEFNKPEISRSLASFIKSFKTKRALVLTKDYFGTARTKTGCEVLFWPVYYF